MKRSDSLKRLLLAASEHGWKVHRLYVGERDGRVMVADSAERLRSLVERVAEHERDRASERLH